MNSVELTQALIRCPSVTPVEGGAIALLDEILSQAGFVTRRVDRNGIANLYARFGEDAPVFAFNGHTDVVPIGDESAWTQDPFGANIVDGKIYGRGACDMKSGVAAFVCAAIAFTRKSFVGSIVLLITGDEEGAGVDGTLALLDDLKARGEGIDHSIVGEPTCPNVMGEMVKNGRRGSLTAYIKAMGKQGHVAYPDRAANPVSPMVALLNELGEWKLDDGYTDFQPSNLEVVTVDVGNSANNVIPAEARATLNIRYNPNHTASSLIAEIDARIARFSNDPVQFEVDYQASGDAFLTKQGEFTEMIANAVEAHTGRRPAMSTTGGTSDARFIKDYAEVCEVGLVGSSMHAVDEFVEVAHIEQLTQIYETILERYFDAK